MKNNERVLKGFKRVGDTSSKYGVHPEKFDEDIKRNKEETEKLYGEFIEWVREKKVNPLKFRGLFMKYYEEFIKAGQ